MRSLLMGVTVKRTQVGLFFTFRAPFLKICGCHFNPFNLVPMSLLARCIRFAVMEPLLI